MKSELFIRTTKQPSLKAAWRKVYANGVASRSAETKDEVEAFAVTADKSIRRIQKELRSDRFIFQPAKGKRIPKKKRGDFRPIVVAPVETRIVQRAVLDVLITVDKLQPFIDTPFSFGGIRKKHDDGTAAVPAAIKAVLDAKAAGLEYVRCADISGFFTKISKSQARKIIADELWDDDFLTLFDSCVKVELSNLSALGRDAERFPREDMGVAQGNALSPLLGNILLYDFDRIMNDGDCRCIRYIDDLIMLAPTEKAANACFRRAGRLLDHYGMEFSPDKSSSGAQTFRGGFCFLGIELVNGLIRPDSDAIGRFKQKVGTLLNASQSAMSKPDKEFPRVQALVPTLSRLSGMIVGWAKHYRFCNDKLAFQNLDNYVDQCLREYLGAYVHARNEHPALSRELLGVGTMSGIDWAPFHWPR